MSQKSQIRDEMILAIRRRRLTQARVAASCGLTESQLSNYLRGKSDLLSESVFRVLDYLRVPNTLSPGDGGYQRTLSSASQAAAYKIDQLEGLSREALLQFVEKYHREKTKGRGDVPRP